MGLLVLLGFIRLIRYIVFHKRSPSFSLGIAKLKFGLLPRYLSGKRSETQRFRQDGGFRYRSTHPT